MCLNYALRSWTGTEIQASENNAVFGNSKINSSVPAPLSVSATPLFSNETDSNRNNHSSSSYSPWILKKSAGGWIAECMFDSREFMRDALVNNPRLSGLRETTLKIVKDKHARRALGLNVVLNGGGVGILGDDEDAGGSDSKIINSEARGNGIFVILYKPKTFMNLSGTALKKVMREYGVSLPKDVLVCHDELDKPLGYLGLKAGGGSSGGHNGVRSIATALGGVQVSE